MTLFFPRLSSSGPPLPPTARITFATTDAGSVFAINFVLVAFDFLKGRGQCHDELTIEDVFH